MEVPELQKKLKGLTKKMKQIDKLKAMEAKGDEMNSDQVAKLQTFDAVSAQMKEIEGLIAQKS